MRIRQWLLWRAAGSPCHCCAYAKAEVCYILPDVSPTTVEAVLAGMVKAGLVEKIGTARNTKYARVL